MSKVSGLRSRTTVKPLSVSCERLGHVARECPLKGKCL